MAILTTKQVNIFTVIYYIMHNLCNNLVNSIENANIRGSCGILWYPAVSCGNQTPPFSYTEIKSGTSASRLGMSVTTHGGSGRQFVTGP